MACRICGHYVYAGKPCADVPLPKDTTVAQWVTCDVCAPGEWARSQWNLASIVRQRRAARRSLEVL